MVICSEIFRVVLRNDIKPYYVAIWLNTKPAKLIFDRIKTGAMMGHISQEVLGNIKIPLPSLAIQDKIAKEVKRRMQKADALQKQAREELEQAKQEVGRMILGRT